MAYFDEGAIDLMLAEVGEDVTIGGVTGKAVFDETDEELLRAAMAHLLGKSVAMTVRTSKFPALIVGIAVLRVGPPSTNYQVFQRIQLGDGALTKTILART